MLSLLLLVIFGLGMAFFATQNIATTTIILAGHIYKGVPLYIIVIGALLLGIFVSWLISIVDALSSTLTIHGRDKAIKKQAEINNDLKKRMRELEIENAKLSGRRDTHTETGIENRKRKILAAA